MPTADSSTTSILYTVGHGDRPIDELMELLEHAGIKTLVDVRSHPYSHRHPQFSDDGLRAATAGLGIEYHWAGRQLGGIRKPDPQSPHSALTNDGLRAYADYMATDAFEIAAQQLIRLGSRTPLCILCAERLPQYCHRSLIADYLTLRGIQVVHLLGDEHSPEHHLRAELRRESARLVYDQHH